MRMLAWVGAVALFGCGASEPREVSLGGISLPPPSSLIEIATEVRAAGGFVFVGSPGPATATDPLYQDAPYEGVRVEFPRAMASVTVEDDLGAPMDGEMLLVATAGPVRLVDDDGSPSAEYVISQGVEDAWEQRAMPGDGTWLFFTRPDGDDEIVFWRAAIEGRSASGVGTGDGASIALDELRLTP